MALITIFSVIVWWANNSYFNPLSNTFHFDRVKNKDEINILIVLCIIYLKNKIDSVRKIYKFDITHSL